MTRLLTVELRAAGGVVLEEIEASVLATDAALVDMARRQAEIPSDRFATGEVVA